MGTGKHQGRNVSPSSSGGKAAGGTRSRAVVTLQWMIAAEGRERDIVLDAVSAGGTTNEVLNYMWNAVMLPESAPRSAAAPRADTASLKAMSLKAPWLYCAVVVLRKNRFPDIDIPLRIPPANHLRLRTSFGHIHCKCWSVRAPKFHAGDDGTNAPMATSLHQPPVVVVLRDDGQGSGTGSHCTLAEGVFTELTKPLVMALVSANGTQHLYLRASDEKELKRWAVRLYHAIAMASGNASELMDAARREKEYRNKADAETEREQAQLAPRRPALRDERTKIPA